MKTLLILAFVSSAFAQNYHAISEIGQDHGDTTIAGNFVFYKFTSDSTVVLSWGNARIHRTYPDTLAYDMRYQFKLLWDTDGAICLQQSCGSPCWTAYILPLDNTREVIVRAFPYSYEPKRGLIAYAYSGVNTDTAVVVENFITHHKRYFLAAKCSSFASAPFMCLEDVKLRGDSLYYSWSTDNPDSVSERTVWLGFQNAK